VIRKLLLSLLKDLLIMVALLAASAVLPLAAFPLCRDPVGAQVVFWLGPFTASVWCLLASVLVGSQFWLGREHVLAWRAARGGYVRSSLKATGWMFFGLFGSFACEGAYLFLLDPSPLSRSLFPLSTYAPVALALWSAARG
jgi:hypothetical protein